MRRVSWKLWSALGVVGLAAAIVAATGQKPGEAGASPSAREAEIVSAEGLYVLSAGRLMRINPDGLKVEASVMIGAQPETEKQPAEESSMQSSKTEKATAQDRTMQSSATGMTTPAQDRLFVEAGRVFVLHNGTLYRYNPDTLAVEAHTGAMGAATKTQSQNEQKSWWGSSEEESKASSGEQAAMSGQPREIEHVKINGDMVYAITPDRILRLNADTLKEDSAVALSEAVGAASSFIAKYDKNADGVVTRDEYTGDMAQFDRLDRNGDGEITREEAPQPAAAETPAGTPQFAAGEAGVFLYQDGSLVRLDPKTLKVMESADLSTAAQEGQGEMKDQKEEKDRGSWDWGE